MGKQKSIGSFFKVVKKKSTTNNSNSNSENDSKPAAAIRTGTIASASVVQRPAKKSVIDVDVDRARSDTTTNDSNAVAVAVAVAIEIDSSNSDNSFETSESSVVIIDESSGEESDTGKSQIKFSFRNGIHCVRLNLSTLMKPEAHPSVRALLHDTCEKMFVEGLLAGVIRMPVSHSSTSAQLLVEDLPTAGVPIIYVLYRDLTLKAIAKVGMSTDIQNRYSKEILKRCHVLCSSGWITVELDRKFEELLNEFIDNLLECPQVPEALKDLFRIYRRGGDDLGMEGNLYLQLIEIACQIFLCQRQPAEAFTCDEKKLSNRRGQILATANYLMPKLAQLVTFRATKENTHCTCSWNTGAPDGILSSKLVLTDYMSGKAPRHDTLPIAVYPNGVGADERFSEAFSENAKSGGRGVAKTNIKRCTKEPRVEFLDTNELIFPNQPLDELLIQLGFRCFANVESPTKNGFLFKIFLFPKTESVIFLHTPLGVGMDSRDVVSLEASLARLESAEMMRLMLKGLQTGQTNFSLEDLPADDAVFTGYVLESTTRCYHQNKRMSCAAARDVLTEVGINALVQNALKKRDGRVKGICKVARQNHLRVNPEIARAVDRYIALRSVNLLSYHALKSEFEPGFAIPQQLIDGDNLGSIIIMVDDRFAFGVDARTKSKRWQLLFAKMMRELEARIRTFRDDTLKQTVGNHLPPPSFDVEENDDVLAPLYDGKPFWVRDESPTDDEKDIIPSNFGTTRTYLKEPNWDFVTDHITTLTFGGVKERCQERQYKTEPQKTKNKRAQPPPSWSLYPYKQRKVFVDKNNGRIFKSGVPKMPNFTYNPISGGMTWCLIRILPTKSNANSNGNKKKKAKKSNNNRKKK